ncbi:MAG: metallophosphoesterase [Flammeovirgaceae bacterium]|nr:MAG: metallophosphoesterase [Flammeovirgaceae bacterium]
MKRFVIGDIHGARKALLQCFEQSGFDYETDLLICLGDVCDGWPETKAAVDELLKVKNLHYILGNHDYLALKWMQYGIREDVWLEQGGLATLQSYREKVNTHHKDFFERALPYFILENKLFVHAGFNPLRPIEEQTLNDFLWDRNLARIAIDFYNKEIDAPLTVYDEVYLGHTPITSGKPLHSCGIWLMDTGAGWSGVLSMMDIDTKEFFTSDPVPSLYPGIEGRKRIT